MVFINGFTKTKVMNRVKKYNNGTKCTIDSSPICVYFNSSTNNRCLFGCFIPRGHASIKDNFEGPVSELLKKYPDLNDFMPLNYKNIKQFQRLHDVLRLHENLYNVVKSWLEMKVKE